MPWLRRGLGRGDEGGRPSRPGAGGALPGWPHSRLHGEGGGSNLNPEADSDSSRPTRIHPGRLGFIPEPPDRSHRQLGRPAPGVAPLRPGQSLDSESVRGCRGILRPARRAGFSPSRPAGRDSGNPWLPSLSQSVSVGGFRHSLHSESVLPTGRAALRPPPGGPSSDPARLRSSGQRGGPCVRPEGRPRPLVRLPVVSARPSGPSAARAPAVGRPPGAARSGKEAPGPARWRGRAASPGGGGGARGRGLKGGALQVGPPGPGSGPARGPRHAQGGVRRHVGSMSA